jgi:hypothetical protein
MPLRNPSDRAGVAGVLVIAWAIVMTRVPPEYPFPHIFNHDVAAPVLALELSHNEGDIQMVLHRKEAKEDKEDKNGSTAQKKDRKRKQAFDYERKNNYLDLVLIPLYTFFLWSLARVFTNRARLLTALIIGAGLFDYVEDWRIDSALNGENPAIFIPSLMKWGLVGLVLFGTGIILVRSKSPVYSLATKRLLAVAYFISGLLMLIAVALGDWIGYSLIELGFRVFGLLIVINVVGLLGHYLAIPGIRPKFVENFCEERKKAGKELLIAVEPEPSK